MRITGRFRLRHYRGGFLRAERFAWNNYTVEGMAALWRRLLFTPQATAEDNHTFMGLIQGAPTFVGLDYDEDTILSHVGWVESQAYEVQFNGRAILTDDNFFTYESAEGTAHRENFTQYIKDVEMEVERSDYLRGMFLTSAHTVLGTFWSDGVTPGAIYCEAAFDEDIRVRRRDRLLFDYIAQGSSQLDGPVNP